MHRAFRSTTMDIILSYALAGNYDILLADNFSHPIVLGYEFTFPLALIFKHFTFTFYILISMMSIFQYFNPGDRKQDVRRMLTEKIDQLVAHPEYLDNEEHETIFHHLLVPHPEKGIPGIPTKKSLLEEAVNLVAAGSDTVGNTCTVGTFYILSDPAVRSKLVKELEAVWPMIDSTPSLETLEKLPYLVGTVEFAIFSAKELTIPWILLL